MKTLMLRKVGKDNFGRIEVRERSYDLDMIAKIEYGRMIDFHNESDIIGNGMDENEDCMMITFLSMSDGEPDKATFGSGWQITFE